MGHLHHWPLVAYLLGECSCSHHRNGAILRPTVSRCYSCLWCGECTVWFFVRWKRNHCHLSVHLLHVASRMGWAWRELRVILTSLSSAPGTLILWTWEEGLGKKGLEGSLSKHLTGIPTSIRGPAAADFSVVLPCPFWETHLSENNAFQFSE